LAAPLHFCGFAVYAITMHIFFSGIGGSGIGPLALIAKQAGYDVSGSDKQESAYTHQLKQQGVTLHIGQTEEALAALHKKKPIDWLVFSSANSRAP
jgi:UDP-N-acetylmuramate--alanine ligase